MYGRAGRGLGIYLAHGAQERHRREQARLAREASRSRREITKQQARLEQWLHNPNNRALPYYDNVTRAFSILAAPLEQHASLFDIQSKRDDLVALNQSLVTGEVMDLLERAKARMESACPLAITLGTCLAVIGLGVIIASTAFALCPVLMVAGIMIMSGGVGAVLAGSKSVPSNKTFALFSVARAIDHSVDAESVYQYSGCGQVATR